MIIDYFNLRWQDLVDIVLTAVLIYQLLLFLRGTQGIQVLAGILVLLLAYWGARRLDLFTLNWFLESFVKSLLLIIIILFQADIRRMLTRVGRRAVSRFGYSEPQVLEEIAAAADSLAKSKFGGLFVYYVIVNLRDFQEGGIRLDAIVSRELLVTLFWPSTPTHDGAVIISGDRSPFRRLCAPFDAAIRARQISWYPASGWDWCHGTIRCRCHHCFRREEDKFPWLKKES